MKKIFRMALVLALAGGTLLYTGCTKDYSEEISNLEKQVTTDEGTIKSLTDQVNTLNGQLSELKSANSALNKTIEGLNSTIDGLKGQISKLETAKANLEGDVEAINKTITELKGTISSLENRVKALEDAKKANEEAITALQNALKDKADKATVESELAKKADISWVNETLKSYVTAGKLNEEVGKLEGAIGTVKDDLKTVSGQVTDLLIEVGKKADKADVEAIQKTLTDMSNLITPALERLVAVENKVKEIEPKVSQAVSDIAELKEALKAKADKAYVDQVAATLATKQELSEEVNKLNEELAKKLNISDWNTAKEQIERAIQDVDNRAQIAISTLANEKASKNELTAAINALREEINNKLTPLTDRVAALESALSGIETNMDKLINRVQSLTYIPDYDDGKITIAYGELVGNINNGFGALNPALVDDQQQPLTTFPFDLRNPDAADMFGSAWNDLFDPTQGYTVVSASNENLESAPRRRATNPTAGNANTPNWNALIDPQNQYGLAITPKVMLPTVVKYKVQGINATSTTEGIAQAWNDNKTAGILNFDLVTVLTRAAGDEPELEIIDVVADVDTLKITVKPNNFPEDFFLGRGTSYSTSLELHQPDTSRFIASCYNNLIAANQPVAIKLAIYDGDTDVTNKWPGVDPTDPTNNNPAPASAKGDETQFGDYIEIEYTNTNDTILFKDFALKAVVGNNAPVAIEDLGNISVGGAVKYFWWKEDLTQAVDPTTLPNPYILTSIDSDELHVQLEDVYSGGVGAELFAQLVYFVGNTAIGTGGLVRVVPVTIELNAEDLAFTWDYEQDAAIDSAIFNNQTDTFYVRKAQKVVTAEELAKLTAADLDIADFSHYLPDSTHVSATLAGADEVEKGQAGPAAPIDILDHTYNTGARFNMVPAIVNGELYADVCFNFQTRDEYNWYAEYNFPNAQKPSVTVKLKGKVNTTDRGRDTIVINLPTYLADQYVPTFTRESRVANDSLYAADGGVLVEGGSVVLRNNGETAEPTPFVTNGLKTTDNITDAFGKTYAVPVSGNATIYYRDNAAQDWQSQTGAVSKYAPKTLVATDDKVLDFTTEYVADFEWVNGKELRADSDYQSNYVLWYGQAVQVNKKVEFDVDGAFEFERIREYVSPRDPEGFWSAVQPLWTKDAAKTPADLPVSADTKVYGFFVGDVIIDQHFRVVDNRNGRVVATVDDDIDRLGELKAEYAGVLDRTFYLVNADGDLVAHIDDPRTDATTGVYEIKKLDGTVITTDFGNPLFVDPDLIPSFGVDLQKSAVVDPNTGAPTGPEFNRLSYYSKSPNEHVYGVLSLVYPSGNKLVQRTSFDRPIDRDDSPVNGEVYDQYYVKQYDPIGKFTVADDEVRINVNNSTNAQTSIYEYLTLKDSRGRDLISGGAWVDGNAYPEGNRLNNGYANGRDVENIYHLVIVNTMEFVGNVDPETKTRFAFDETTGVVSYLNNFQTRLQEPVTVKLGVRVEYPWGTRGGDETYKEVTFYWNE